MTDHDACLMRHGDLQPLFNQIDLFGMEPFVTSKTKPGAGGHDSCHKGNCPPHSARFPPDKATSKQITWLTFSSGGATWKS